MQVDLSNLDLEMRQKIDEILRGRLDRNLWEAAERQRRVAKFYRDNPPQARDGFGPQTVAVDPVFDAYWRCYYGHDYSEDSDKVRFLIKRNPEIEVRAKGTKIMVGWAPGSESRKPVGIRVKQRGEMEDGRGKRAEGGDGGGAR